MKIFYKFWVLFGVFGFLNLFAEFGNLGKPFLLLAEIVRLTGGVARLALELFVAFPAGTRQIRGSA